MAAPERWFRRPDGGLQVTGSVEEAARWLARGWEPVDAEKAVAEVQDGTQKKLARKLRAASSEADRAQLLREHAEARAKQRAAARRIVADAQVKATPPQGQQPSADGQRVANEEKGTN